MRRMIAASALACAALAWAAPAPAQTSGLGSSGIGSSGIGSSGSSGLGSGGLSSSGFGGSSSLGGSSSGFGMSSSAGFGTSSTTSGNAITGGASTGAGGRSGSAAVGSSSFEGAYFINPFSLGLVGPNGTISTTSNFGAPLFTLPTNTTGTASINSQNTMANGYGSGVGIRRLPAYATTLKFAIPPPPPPPQVRADLQNMLTQTTQLDPRDAVRITMDGRIVVLQGHVVDDDERRLVQNMILLTPGVNQVRNELSAGRAGAPSTATGLRTESR